MAEKRKVVLVGYVTAGISETAQTDTVTARHLEEWAYVHLSFVFL